MGLLTWFGDVGNEDIALKVLEEEALEFVGASRSEIVTYVNKKSKENKIRYFDSLPSYNELEDWDCSGSVAWLATGCTKKSSLTGDIFPIYAQFTRCRSGWMGVYIGTESEIKDEAIAHKNKTKPLFKDVQTGKLTSSASSSTGTSSSDKVLDDSTEKFVNELVDDLLVSDEFSKVPHNLRAYLDSIICRFNHRLSEGVDCADYLILNKPRTWCIFSSGLLDKYANPILVLTRYLATKNELVYIEMRKLPAMQELEKLDFEPNKVLRTIKRIPFWNSNDDLVFDGIFEDFDILDRSRLHHCIEERIERYPEIYRNLPIEVLCQDLILQLRNGIKISEYDHTYVKPFYYRARNAIHFIIPFRVFGDYSMDKPLGIVVRKQDNGLWGIMTIFTHEDSYRNIHMLCPYTSFSF